MPFPNLPAPLSRALTERGYAEPTPVQAEAVPAALAGRDLIVSAQTGTGKTAAFMLPALSAIADEPRKPGRGPRVLVLTPTRELAQQVTAAAQKYGSELRGLRTVSSEVAGVLTLLEPLAAAVIAAIALHERMTWLGIAGAVLMLAAIVGLYVRGEEPEPVPL